MSARCETNKGPFRPITGGQYLSDLFWSDLTFTLCMQINISGQNSMKAQIMKKHSETAFNKVSKVSSNSTTLISQHLLSESGDVVVIISMTQTACSQTSAADTGRLTETKHVIYTTVNQLEIRHFFYTPPKECGVMWSRPPLYVVWETGSKMHPERILFTPVLRAVHLWLDDDTRSEQGQGLCLYSLVLDHLKTRTRS